MCRLCGGDDALQGLDAVSFTAIAVKSEDTSIDDFVSILFPEFLKYVQLICLSFSNIFLVHFV